MEPDRKAVSGSDPADVGVDNISYYYEEMLKANLVELEVSTPQGKVVLKRASAQQDHPASTPHSAPAAHSKRSSTEAKHDALPANVKVISSPIMGMFYRASSPQSQPFSKEGDEVNAGQTICIVEAMKVMNEIRAEAKCKILKILGENGKPVTKGQPLFQVELL